MKKDNINKIMALIDDCYYDGLYKYYPSLSYNERIEKCKDDILKMIRGN